MADTTVKIFDSTMTGAPTLSNTAGSLIAILDACLKDGFGLKTVDSIVVSGGVATANVSTGHSAKVDMVMLMAGSSTSALNGEKKVVSYNATTFTFDATGVADGTYTGSLTTKVAPAGWTKPFSGTNLAAYRSSNINSPRHFFRFDDTNTNDTRWYGCESMTDIATPTSKFPTDAQVAGGYYIGKCNSTGSRLWWVIADDRTVYIATAWQSSYPNEHAISSFGDFVSRKPNDNFCSYACGHTNAQWNITPTPSYEPLFNKSAASNNYSIASRSHNPMTLAQQLLPMFSALGNTATSGMGSFPFPSPADNSLVLEPILLYESISYVLRGKVPGVLACPQAVYGGILDNTVLPAVPGYTGRKFWWKSLGGTSPSSRGGYAIDITGPWEH